MLHNALMKLNKSCNLQFFSELITTQFENFTWCHLKQSLLIQLIPFHRAKLQILLNNILQNIFFKRLNHCPAFPNRSSSSSFFPALYPEIFECSQSMFWYWSRRNNLRRKETFENGKQRDDDCCYKTHTAHYTDGDNMVLADTRFVGIDGYRYSVCCRRHSGGVIRVYISTHCSKHNVGRMGCQTDFVSGNYGESEWRHFVIDWYGEGECLCSARDLGIFQVSLFYVWLENRDGAGIGEKRIYVRSTSHFIGRS